MPQARRLPPAARGVLPQALRGHPARSHGLTAGANERYFAVEGPYDFDETVRFVPFGPYDPTARWAPGVLLKAARTPEGTGTLCLRRAAGGVLATAWGEGASWLLERAPAVAGAHDDPSSFAPVQPEIRRLVRRHRGLRLSRQPWVFDGLAEYVLQQRVRFRDAAKAQRRLVAAISPPAPGPPGQGLPPEPHGLRRPAAPPGPWLPPAPADRLRVPLGPADWLQLRSDDFVRAGIDGQRSRTLRAAAREARRIDHTFELATDAARGVLATIPGCGAWTVEFTMGLVLGDPDAAPRGDLHLPGEIGWLLAGEPHADDRRMLELLAPFCGHRFRLIRVLLAAGELHLGRAAAAARRLRPARRV